MVVGFGLRQAVFCHWFMFAMGGKPWRKRERSWTKETPRALRGQWRPLIWAAGHSMWHKGCPLAEAARPYCVANCHLLVTCAGSLFPWGLMGPSWWTMWWASPIGWGLQVCQCKWSIEVESMLWPCQRLTWPLSSLAFARLSQCHDGFINMWRRK